MVDLIKNGTIVRVPLSSVSETLTPLIDFLKIDSSTIKKKSQVIFSTIAVTVDSTGVRITAVQDDHYESPTAFQVYMPNTNNLLYNETTNYYQSDEFLKIADDLVIEITGSTDSCIGSTFELVVGTETLEQIVQDETTEKRTYKVCTESYLECGETLLYRNTTEMSRILNAALLLDPTKLGDVCGTLAKLISLTSENEEGVIVTTDAHVLHKTETFSTNLSEKVNVLFPTFALLHYSKIKKSKNFNGNCTFTVSPINEGDMYNSVVYLQTAFGTYRYTTTNKSDRFPDWVSVVPEYTDGLVNVYSLDKTALTAFFTAYDATVKRKKALYNAMPAMSRNTDYANSLVKNTNNLGKFIITKENDKFATVKVEVSNYSNVLDLYFEHTFIIDIKKWTSTNETTEFGFNLEFLRNLLVNFECDTIDIYQKCNKAKGKILTEGNYKRNDDGTFYLDEKGDMIWIDTVFEPTTESEASAGCAFVFTYDGHGTLREDFVGYDKQFSLLMPVMLGNRYY